MTINEAKRICKAAGYRLKEETAKSLENYIEEHGGSDNVGVYFIESKAPRTGVIVYKGDDGLTAVNFSEYSRYDPESTDSLQCHFSSGWVIKKNQVKAIEDFLSKNNSDSLSTDRYGD
jgi:hypothetical protein